MLGISICRQTAMYRSALPHRHPRDNRSLCLVVKTLVYLDVEQWGRSEKSPPARIKYLKIGLNSHAGKFYKNTRRQILTKSLSFRYGNSGTMSHFENWDIFGSVTFMSEACLLVMQPFRYLDREKRKLIFYRAGVPLIS